MPETRQYTVYKFSELPEDAKEKVIERYRDWNVEDSYWYEHFNDFLKDDLKEFGLDFKSFSFSGFYSQGDGRNRDGIDLVLQKVRASIAKATGEIK